MYIIDYKSIRKWQRYFTQGWKEHRLKHQDIFIKTSYCHGKTFIQCKESYDDTMRRNGMSQLSWRQPLSVEPIIRIAVSVERVADCTLYSIDMQLTKCLTWLKCQISYSLKRKTFYGASFPALTWATLI
jgi:hypothetical protein